MIAIFAVLVIGVTGSLRGRARRAQCIQNLKSLYIGADLYLQQNNQWPQIAVGAAAEAQQEAARLWIAALEPFNVPRKTWICPEIQQLLENPDYTQPENVRIDYLPCPFDDKPATPHQWPTQPWFIERGDVHGNGNLIIFTDGRVVAARELQQH